MKDIRLHIGFEKWLLFNSLFYVLISVFLFFGGISDSIQTILLVALIDSLIVTAALIGIFNYSHKEVILTNDRVIIIGWEKKVIPYVEIEKIGVGSGGIAIYGNNSHVNITYMQSNFNLAKERVQQLLQLNQKIIVVGPGKYIKKYLLQS